MLSIYISWYNIDLSQYYSSVPRLSWAIMSQAGKPSGTVPAALQLLFSLEGVEVENWLDLNVLKLVYFSQCNCQTYTGIQFLAIPRDTLRSSGSSWRLKGSGSDPQIRIRLCTGIQFPRDPTKGNTVIMYYLSIRLSTTKSDPYSTWEICCRNKLNMHR